MTAAAGLRREGFAFVRAPETKGLLGPLPDWEALAASWNDLRPDTYRPEGDRLRRHAALALVGGAVAVSSRRAHFQSREHNPLYGGVERWYEPIEPALLSGPSVRAVLAACAGLFDPIKPGKRWDVELHQFRILARAGVPGKPTPEGIHRDGVDFALALLVRRENVASGTTTVHAPSGAPLGSFTLAEPLDAAFVDDARVLHGVTPVTPLAAGAPAYRDVLVATFTRPAA